MKYLGRDGKWHDIPAGGTVDAYTKAETDELLEGKADQEEIEEVSAEVSEVKQSLGDTNDRVEALEEGGKDTLQTILRRLGVVETSVGNTKPKIVVASDGTKLISVNDGTLFEIVGVGIVNNFIDYFRDTLVSDSAFDQLVADGFNSIRFMFNTKMFIDIESEEIRTENVNTLEDIISRARDKNINVILDMHGFDTSLHFDGCFSENSVTNGDAIIKVWTTIVRVARKYNNVLAYSLLNEPALTIQSNTEINKKRALNVYYEFVQVLINKIKELDKYTAIILNHANQYINTSGAWVASAYNDDDEFFYNIVCDGLIEDFHYYPHPLAYDEGDNPFARLQESGLTEDGGHYKNSAYGSSDEEVEIKIVSNGYSKIGLLYFSIANADGATFSPNYVRASVKYADGTIADVLNITSETTSKYLDSYRIKETLMSPLLITKSVQNLYFNPAGTSTTMECITLKPNEELTIKASCHLDNASSDSTIRLTARYFELSNGTKYVVSSAEVFADMLVAKANKEISHHIPIYFGEYAIKQNYCSDAYNYKQLVDAFNAFCKEYNVNRIWHSISSFDSEYVLYSDYVISEGTKITEKWEYAAPSFLERNAN